MGTEMDGMEMGWEWEPKQWGRGGDEVMRAG